MTPHQGSRATGSPVSIDPRGLSGTLQPCSSPSHNKEYVKPRLGKTPKRGPTSGDPSRLALLLERRHRIPRRGGRWALSGVNPNHTYEERFWARVERGPGCWLWTGPTNPDGYGIFSGVGHAIHAQRVAYAFTYGVPPAGHCVCHHCDTRACVRPDHLFAATQGDNLRDMVRKGRHPEQTHRETHCKRGHEYTPENTYTSCEGTRSCKTCGRTRWSK